MKAFKLRLEQALGSGAAMALLSIPACGGSAAVDRTTNSATAGQAGLDAGAAGNGNQLTPYPTTGLGCSGPVHDGGFYGQCCAEALCYTPADGSECAAPNDAPAKLGTFYGSGSCLCGEAPAIRGPFAANPTDEPKQPGSCCYVISSITCEGRPLLVDGTPIVCSLVERSDWLVTDLLGLSV
ncbi:MAG TPA: hypothetical protein VER96_01655 [Polyangiaceae bacterium]|nr:hypothetical protein [Polyangiaceae bacterium]